MPNDIVFKDLTKDIAALTVATKKLRLLVQESPSIDLRQRLTDSEKYLRRLMRTDIVREAHKMTLDRTNKNPG